MPDLRHVESAAKPKKKSADSHENEAASYGLIYVNEVARHALLNEKKPQFPVGSIIVREKLAKEGDTAPQLLVALVKHERGFNAKANDWEFLVLDGKASVIQRREKTGSCQTCHAQQKETDFVFRSYLSEAVRREQR
jgi:hypothetical protein